MGNSVDVQNIEFCCDKFIISVIVFHSCCEKHNHLEISPLATCKQTLLQVWRHFSPSAFSPVLLHPQVWEELRGVHVSGERGDGKLQEVPTLLLLLRPRGRAEERDPHQTVQLQRALPLPGLAHLHDDRGGGHRGHGKADSVPFPALRENPEDQQIGKETSPKFNTEYCFFSFFTKEP